MTWGPKMTYAEKRTYVVNSYPNFVGIGLNQIYYDLMAKTMPGIVWSDWLNYVAVSKQRPMRYRRRPSP